MGGVQGAVDGVGQNAEEALDGIHEGACPGEDGLEEQEHHGEENDGAPHRVQQHAVDFFGGGVRGGGLVVGRVQNGINPGGAFRRGLRRSQRGGGPVGRVGQLFAQLRNADAAVPQYANCGDAQGCPQGFDVETAGTLAQLVGHGDRQAGGQTQGEGFGHEVHAAAQGGGIDHHHQGVRSFQIGVGDSQGVGNDLLVGADRIQRVGAG